MTSHWTVGGVWDRVTPVVGYLFPLTNQVTAKSSDAPFLRPSKVQWYAFLPQTDRKLTFVPNHIVKFQGF